MDRTGPRKARKLKVLTVVSAGEGLHPNASYFDRQPERVEQHGSYVGEPTTFQHPVTYQWQHTLGDIASAAAGSGLQIEYVHEWPMAAYRAFESMQPDGDGYWRLPGDPWPLLFSLRAIQPE